MDIKKDLINIFKEVGFNLEDKDDLEYLDSITFISIMLQIEKFFNITIPDEYLNFSIINNIDGFILLIENLIKN